jgi:pyruvate dehydrogenase E2 component (dihydrolipoyllysine-residue acetyltransferase)
MAISVVMPALEMAQETGKLLAWRKKEGEKVNRGEPLLEIETDKAVVEVEAPGDGILAGITAEVGAVIPVGETIAWLVAPGEKPPARAASAAPTARASSGGERASAAATLAVQQPGMSAPQISPKARRLAKELGVDITRVRGTGPEGTITTEDVQKFADAKGAAALPSNSALSQVARLMAERTTQSWTTVPHFFLVREVDASALVETQKRLASEVEKDKGARLTITDLLIGVTARVLTKHPRMNSSWSGEGIHSNPEINISVAIAVKDGVVGAVVHKANVLKLGEIAARRRDLTERARAGRLQPADISGGTFTISNLGMYKVDAFMAIIAAPQAAILAVGSISDRVVAVEGRPAVRPMMTLTLSSDHRVVDGARAAEFLSELSEALREPGKWLG